MKKFLSVLMAALCALLPMLALAQESTTIMTTVPSSHTITVICGEHGRVTAAGKTFAGTHTVEVKRLADLTIIAEPDTGYALSQVLASQTDGVRVEGQKIVLSGVYCDQTITVTFAQPTATPTPTVTPKPTATPTAKPTAKTTATPTVKPTVTPASSPVLGETSLANRVVIPWMSGTGNRLYDAYLGTGLGMKQLNILYDGEYQAVDYELLAPEQEGGIYISTVSDGMGEAAQHSLMLSFAQLVNLAQKQGTQRIAFANGGATAAVDMLDLLGEEMYKLLGLALAGEETLTQDSLGRDWSKEPAAELAAADLAAALLEIRIVPVTLEDGALAYEISVWLHCGERALEISSMLPSLRVCLNADALEGDAQTLAQRYGVGFCAQDAQEVIALDSVFVYLPGEPEADGQADEAERFTVAYSPDGGFPTVTRETGVPLEGQRRAVLAAQHAGAGRYQVVRLP